MALIKIRWGRQEFLVDFDVSLPPSRFRDLVADRTGVPPCRQKLLLHRMAGTVLIPSADEAGWGDAALHDLDVVLLVGSCEVLGPPPAAREADDDRTLMQRVPFILVVAVALFAVASNVLPGLKDTGDSGPFPYRSSAGEDGGGAPGGGAAAARSWDAERDHVVDMMRHAWNGYVGSAWGSDEVRPVTGAAFEWLGLGASIVDSLDTLRLMRLDDELSSARAWVDEYLAFDSDLNVSVFETSIRVLGGLLSVYDLTRDSVYLDKAVRCADILVDRAFSRDDGLPYATINFYTREAFGKPNLAEAGSFQLEFLYLSRLTGDPKYREAAERSWDALTRYATEDLHGLYPVDLRSGSGGIASLGGASDSFYEYLLKSWIALGGPDAAAAGAGAGGWAPRLRAMYDDATDAIMKRMVKVTRSGLVFVSDVNSTHSILVMEHLACFAPGMLALGSLHGNATLAAGNHRSREHFALSKSLARTCREMYRTQPTGLGPEFVAHSAAAEGDDFVATTNRQYLLRPEVVESYFYLWRYTHDERYRRWGWEVVEALERHCRAPHGYSTLYDVTVGTPVMADAMPSYFLAETLKYLWLLFSDDGVVPLDRYVFNTEGHPFPIPTAASS
eukprot:m51a1_g1411 putative alpha mannosidase (617) ;mRNA; f:18153-20665